MQRLQNVCEQLVIIGVVKKSLHTWQRKDDSTDARAARGVWSQSVLSEKSSLPDIAEKLVMRQTQT
jgi:hypothetical protein